MKDVEGFRGFDTWTEVLAWVELGGEVYYKSPLDLQPKRVAVERVGQCIRVEPLRGRDFDKFFADEDHRPRFLREDAAPASPRDTMRPLEETRAEGAREAETLTAAPKFWGYGAGYPGCLYDHCMTIGTRGEAVNAAASCYELDAEEREELDKAGIIRFKSTEFHGVPMIELFETSESPEQEEEPVTLKQAETRNSA